MTNAVAVTTRNMLREWGIRSRPRRIRTIFDFAHEEVVVPEGPFRNRKFNWRRQPYSKLALDAIDSGLWNRFAAVGPTQSGKTFHWSLIPLMYHLFEIQETVVFGLPNMDMARDKWQVDIEPVIAASRYRDLIPRAGGGSRGGTSTSIRFRNGSIMRFMSGGGGEKSRAAFTARVVIITEVDGMDRPNEESLETDKVSQIEARSMAFGDRRITYLECTVTTEDGRIWQEKEGGSRGRILIRCQRCREFVCPDREHLVGWREARTEMEAKRSSHFICPSCKEPWTEEDRKLANLDAVLLHGDQTVTKGGKVSGALPETDTCGFHWTATNNLFRSAGDLGRGEWLAQRREDDEEAEKEQCQYVWSRPWKPPITDVTPLDSSKLTKRVRSLPRGVIPSNHINVALAVDIGKHLCYWGGCAFSPNFDGHIFDYGCVDVHSKEMAVEQALPIALRELWDMAQAGWRTEDGDIVKPNEIWIDCGWMPDIVYEFCREHAGVVFPSRGYGQNRHMYTRYHRPDRKKNRNIHSLGEQYHVVRIPRDRVFRRDVDSDYWKAFLHERLAQDINSPGAMTLFMATPRDHLALVKHLTAERQIVEVKPRGGRVITWEVVRRANHWLDVFYNVCAIGHKLGSRLTKQAAPQKPRRQDKIPAHAERRGFVTPAGRPFFVMDRK